MVQASDVNEAVLRRAVDELEIDIPIQAWRVEDGQLVLVLAYGGEARWGGVKREMGNVKRENVTDHVSRDGRPWKFVAANRKKDAAAIPEGDLNSLKKQALMLLCLDWGFQTVTLYPKKAEYVEALAWLRKKVASC